MTKFQPPGAPPAATAGPGADEAGTVPLTEQQLALLRRAHPHDTSPNQVFAIDLRGPLDDRELRSALARLVARHPLLSARLAPGPDGPPRLHLDPARTPRLERRTATGHPPTEDEAGQELDLEHTGVLRTVLVAHGPAHHTLLLVMHRLVADGECAGLLLADLLDAYEHGENPAAAPRAFIAHTTTPRAAPDHPAAANSPGHPHETSGPAAPQTLPVAPRQHALLLDALAHHGTGRYVEQLFWHWHGPLDTDRFTAAWQSVFDRETVLRAAFDRDRHPRIVLHDQVTADVVHHRAGTLDWDDLLHQDRLRGFDLRAPGLLRATLLDDPRPTGDTPTGDTPTSDTPTDDEPRATGDTERATSTRVLITFHHALLDHWSVSVLLQEFYRAYLADGLLPGSERRPDIRDYAHWLARQDTAPARAFWSAATGPATPATRPALPGPATGQTGWGRAQTRLSRTEAGRLRRWAATRAATESSMLQAVWALLLYRTGGAHGPAPVGFGVSVSGRGIALDAVERLPGLLANALPVIVRIDPDHSMPRLLAQLRDQAIDMAAYEWVSTAQIHEWSGRGADEKLLESLIVFENRPRTSPALDAALAAHDIRVGPPQTLGLHSAFPITLLASPDTDGGLLLTAVHDRTRISDTDAGRLIGLCARLLRELPSTHDESTTIADIVAALPDTDLPRMTDGTAPVPHTPPT
ncbi:condensation domain-containing protein [Streptomyces sp. NBC_00638]|uniref:condensation domain-containing protein n=1 Tax=Streptomyces sp. NBC_00638 TaxID=2975794 RepID=UPI0022571B7F|nr:condensation domain-containing protein [Streptomyces sp. NBC_00638]MCX5009377.1 condensation domain-containing protein [Streptomyces sp. NBC_00638]